MNSIKFLPSLPTTPSMQNIQKRPARYKQAEKLARLLAAGKQQEATRLAGSARLWAQRSEQGWIIGQHGKKEPLLTTAYDAYTETSEGQTETA